MAPSPQLPQEVLSERDRSNQPLSPSPDWTPLELEGRDPRLPTLYSIPNHPRLSGIEGVRAVYIFLDDSHKSVSARSSTCSTRWSSAFSRPPKGWLVLGEGDYIFSRDQWGDGQPANDVLRVAVTREAPKITNVDSFPHIMPHCIQDQLPKDCVLMWRTPLIHGSPSTGNVTNDPALVSLQDDNGDLDAYAMPGLITPEESDEDSGYVSESA